MNQRVLNADMTPRRTGETTRESRVDGNTDEIVDALPPDDVQTLADVTRGLPLDDATKRSIEAVAAGDRAPFEVGRDVTTLLRRLEVGEGRPGLAREIVQRARRYAMRRWLAPDMRRDGVGAALLAKSQDGKASRSNCPTGWARSWVTTSTRAPATSTSAGSPPTIPSGRGSTSTP